MSYCRYRRRLAALTVACAPLYANPASARLPQSFPSLSSFRAQDSSRHLPTGLSSVYLRLDWGKKIPSPPLTKHLLVDALAHLPLPHKEASHATVLAWTPLPHLGQNFLSQNS